ncbi:MAG: hypothetical protein F9K16_02055, partial [Thermoanaerobaculia bacterium]
MSISPACGRQPARAPGLRCPLRPTCRRRRLSSPAILAQRPAAPGPARRAAHVGWGAMPAAAWSAAEARRFAAAHADPLVGLRIYSSRRLGADPGLVLHGGGNTSVKSTWADPLGATRPVLWVKGSGADLATIDARGFAPVDLEAARRLLALERMGDAAMLAELRRLRLDAEAPTPSVETLLHASLPFRFVDHTHADDALAILTARDATRRAEDLWGEDHLLVPWVMPGFDLARRVVDLWTRAVANGRRPIGLILLRHGVFSFADDARESCERMLAAVARARRARAPRLAVTRPERRRPA